jgi:hypothetical protein
VAASAAMIAVGTVIFTYAAGEESGGGVHRVNAMCIAVGVGSGSGNGRGLWC